MKTGFRFALHHQAALKEQCVRILPSERQRHEVRHRSSHGDVRLICRGTQAAAGDLEVQVHRHVVDLQTKAAAGQLRQAPCNRLPTQQMIHRRRHDARGQWLGNDAQDTADELRRMQHEELLESKAAFCHGGESTLLIRIKRTVQ